MVRGSTRSELGKSSQTLHSQIWVVRPDKFSQAPILTSEKSSQTLHSQIWVCLSFSSQIRLCSLSHISLWTLSLWSGVQQRCTLSAEISREKTHTEKWTRPAKSSPRQSDDLSSWQEQIIQSKGWVSIDRSVVAALPSTTPRPVHKSSTDDLGPPLC